MSKCGQRSPGIRAGRDEVLEEGVRQILGRDVPADQIRRIATPAR